MRNKLIVFCFISAFFISCTSSSKINHRLKKDTAIADNIASVTNADFTASGQNPVDWAISVDLTDSIRFTNNQGIYLATRQWKLSQSDSVDIFSCETTMGKMALSIEKGKCSNNTSKKVSVKFENGLHFTGCGIYTKDERLNGKWYLESINGQKYIGTDFARGLPYIEINTEKEYFSGSDGCNKISGNLKIKGKIMGFPGIMSTKIGCSPTPFANQLEQKISGKGVRYYFSAQKLYFYLSDDTTIVFYK